MAFNSRAESIASVPLAHFDAERIKALFGDLQQSKDASEAIEREARNL
jgi:hypothetical protein